MIFRTLLVAAAIGPLVTILTSMPFAQAQAVAPVRSAPLIVRNDRGGRISPRVKEIAELRRSGRPVEIRGAVCLSTCTMFLGLPQTCLEPGTRFGFHGPSKNGRRLSARDFDYWSQIIAAHYPKPLRDWYMTTGRLRINGYHELNGRALIELGLERCS
jgi:hypothetical protein